MSKKITLKQMLKNRFDKSKPPKGDPDALSELPLWELTKSANVHDSTMFIPIFNLLQNEFNLKIEAVMADGIYDTAVILNYIINTLKAKSMASQMGLSFTSF